MTESKKPWESSNVFDWYFSEDNDAEILLPLKGEKIGLNIIAALADIHDAVGNKSNDEVQANIQMLAEIIVGSSMGLANKVLEDLVVGTAMEEFDESLNNLLEEDK